MATASYEFHSEWEKFDGRKVTIDGLAYVIRTRVFEAVYPRREMRITVDAVPVNKNSKAYRETKAILGDDWSTDVLASGIELQCDILRQLEQNQNSESFSS